MVKITGENRKWIVAILASLLFHALFFLCMPVFKNVRNHDNEVIVRLAERNIAHDVLPKNVAKAEPVKQQTVKAKPAKTAEKHEMSVRNNQAEIQDTAVEDMAAANESGEREAASAELPAVNSKSSAAAEIADINSLVITKKVTPQYPAFSRKRREEGTAVLLITIENGYVVNCRIESSSGYARLDEAAKRAVKQWKFAHAENVMARVPVSFKLSD